MRQIDHEQVVTHQDSLSHAAIQHQGSLQDRYEIYRANAESMGWDVKTLDEWLAS